MRPEFTEALSHCTLCPRSCGADRAHGGAGFCGAAGLEAGVARASLHMWEEPCISGERGSGTVFFTGCNLGCVYCQNGEISSGRNTGIAVSDEALARIFLELQEKGAHNINLVTPTHFSLQIIEAAAIARKEGLTVPIVYNCGGFESVETLELLRGTVDVFLTDVKYRSSALAKNLSKAPSYFSAAMAAVGKMLDITGRPAFDEEGILQKGVIARHLVLPGHAADSVKVIRALWRDFGDAIIYSIMNQYTPPEDMELPEELKRPLTAEEYDKVVDAALDMGMENGYIQEGGTVSESFIPAFDGGGII